MRPRSCLSVVRDRVSEYVAASNQVCIHDVRIYFIPVLQLLLLVSCGVGYIPATMPSLASTLTDI